MGVSWQSLENPHMKAALGMPKGMTGVYITKTEPMFEASRVLLAGDVLISFNGKDLQLLAKGLTTCPTLFELFSCFTLAHCLHHDCPVDIIKSCNTHHDSK